MNSLIWTDWLIIGIISLSCLVSIWRGFVREALSLGMWIAACLVSLFFHEAFAFLLADYIETYSLRRMVAIGTLFSATLIVGALLNHLLGEFVRMSGLKGTDRLFGMVFGFVRGVIVVLVFVTFLPALLEVQHDKWWQQSVLIPQFVMLEDWTLQMSETVMSYVSDLNA